MPKLIVFDVYDHICTFQGLNCNNNKKVVDKTEVRLIGSRSLPCLLTVLWSPATIINCNMPIETCLIICLTHNIVKFRYILVISVYRYLYVFKAYME